jgi:hypothetical protein
MSKFKQPGPGERYPLLVSFVGQTGKYNLDRCTRRAEINDLTGAGKSTLIKMLISLMKQKLILGTKSTFESPVAGSGKNDKSPTSGDVHLYIDPLAALTSYPVLYADCEGLDGGEIPPRAPRIRDALKKTGYMQGDNWFESKPREVRVPVTKSEQEQGIGRSGISILACCTLSPMSLFSFCKTQDEQKPKSFTLCRL